MAEDAQSLIPTTVQGHEHVGGRPGAWPLLRGPAVGDVMDPTRSKGWCWMTLGWPWLFPVQRGTCWSLEILGKPDFHSAQLSCGKTFEQNGSSRRGLDFHLLDGCTSLSFTCYIFRSSTTLGGLPTSSPTFELWPLLSQVSKPLQPRLSCSMRRNSLPRLPVTQPLPWGRCFGELWSLSQTNSTHRSFGLQTQRVCYIIIWPREDASNLPWRSMNIHDPWSVGAIQFEATDEAFRLEPSKGAGSWQEYAFP